IEFYQQSLTIAKEIGDRQGEANSLGSLGIAYRSLGQYQKAIEFYQQSLTIAKEIGDRQGEANSLGSLGIAYRSL
ncbi:tetratricopeptide repeat protein, partial [Microcystis aeruginosa]|uniref:tetratricopeptide repeat protein n=1 Tax=Microcystis aeruginosa TaxID=1126 RepID=UPI00114CE3AE